MVFVATWVGAAIMVFVATWVGAAIMVFVATWVGTVHNGLCCNLGRCSP